MTSGDGNATLNSHEENIGDPSATLHEQPSIFLGRSIKQKPIGRGLRLEKLPSELRFAVLCSMPDLETLRSAIRASPALYAQYRNNRDLVAKSCFHNQLSGLLPDAIGALMSRPSVIQSPRTNERINDFLATYKSWLSAPSTSPNPSSLDTDAIRWLVQFHLHIVVPLSQEFSRWAMLNLSKEASFHSPAIDAAVKTGFSLSLSEQCRVMRAIYRTQIYHHLFGRNEGRRNDTLRYDVIQEIFFALFNPWETEIIASFDMYSREFYKKVFDEIAEDIHPDNPKNFHESGARISVEGWDFEYQENDCMDGVISCGLETMIRFYRVRNDHEHLVDTAERYLVGYHNLDATVEFTLETIELSDADRSPAPFAGDRFPPDDPSFGWNLSWQSISAIQFEEDIPDAFRRWAYTIWDKCWWQEFDPVPVMNAYWQETKDAFDAMFASDG